MSRHNPAFGSAWSFTILLTEQALTRLPADQRAAMVLYYFEDMDCAEIARQLGVSLCKVKTDNFRARAKMRKRLHLVREHVGI